MEALLLALLVSTYTVLCTSSSLQDTAINEHLDVTIDSSGEIAAQRTQEIYVPLALSALQPINRRTTADAISTLAELFTLLKQYPRLPADSFILMNEESRAWLLDFILTTHADLREKFIWVRAHQQVHVGRLLTAKSTSSLSHKLEFVRQQITPNGEAQVTIVVHDVPNAVQVASALRIRLGSKKVYLVKDSESFNVEVSLFSRARMVIGGAAHLGTLLAFCPPGAVIIDTARNGKQVVEGLQLKYVAMELSGDVPADVARLISITQQGTTTQKKGAKCPIGTFRDAEGACQLCPAGTYRKFGGDEGCEPCPAGMFAATPGSAVCQLCPPNTFASSFGSANCQQCPEGKAAPVFGQSECIADAAGKKGQLFNAQVAASPYYYYYTRTPTSTLTYMQARTATPTATATNTLPVTQTLTASQTATPTSMYVKPQLNNDCVGTCTEFNVFNNTDTATPQDKPTNIAVAVLDISTILIAITFTSDTSSTTKPGGATLVKLGNVAILVTVRAVISGTTALSITGSANAIITTSTCAELEINPVVDLDIGLKSQGPTTYNQRVGMYRDVEYSGNTSCIVIIVKTSVLNHGGFSHHRDGVQRGDGRHRSVGAGCSSRFHRGFRNHLKSDCALDTSDSRSFRSRYRHFLPLAGDPEVVCNCAASCGGDTTIGGVGAGRLVANACGTGTDACTCTTVNGVATSTVITGDLVVDNGGTVVIHGGLGTLPVIVANGVTFNQGSVISLPDLTVSALTGTTITLFKLSGAGPISTKPTQVLVGGTPVDVSLTNGGLTFTLNIPVPSSPQIPSSPSPQPVAPTPPTPTPSPSGSNAGLAGLAALAVIPVLLIGLAIIWLKLSKPPADEEQVVGPWTKADEPVYYKDDYYGHVAPAPTPTWEYFQEGEVPRGALYGESDAESVLSYKFEDVRAPPSTVAASPFLPAAYAGYPEVSVQIPPSPQTPGTPSEISDYPAPPVQEPWFPQPPSDSSMSTPIDTGNTSESAPTGLWPGY